jgi:hypothetical protein
MATAKRLGVAPADRSAENRCDEGQTCPDIFAVDATGLKLAGTEGMRTGSVYAVVGTLATKEQIERLGLPEDAGVAAYEAIVLIPEEVFLSAAAELFASRANNAAVAV